MTDMERIVDLLQNSGVATTETRIWVQHIIAIRGAVECCRNGMQGAHRNLWEVLNDAFPPTSNAEPK